MSDLISRQAAIDAIDSFDVLDGYQDKLELKSKIEELPSAKNKAFEEMKAELYEREVQAKADKECYPDNEYLEGVFDGLHEAAKLASITTAEPREGKWTEVEICDGKVIEQWQSMKCDQCERYHTTPYLYYVRKARYCPNCGAKMEGEDE